jgi:hypothetical protein
MIVQLLTMGSTFIIALALFLVLVISLALAALRGWALLRHRPGQFVCLAGPILLGCGLGWADGHAAAGAAAGFAAGVLLLAAVRSPRGQLGPFVEGMAFCTLVFGLAGGGLGALLDCGWAGVLSGLVAAQSFSLLALVEDPDRP